MSQMNREQFEAAMITRGFRQTRERETAVGHVATWERGALEVEVDVHVRGPTSYYEMAIKDVDAALDDIRD